MKEIIQTISHLLENDEKVIFLAGAGCSVEAPSSLPDGYKMIQYIVKFLCEDFEIEKILNIPELTLETLLDIICHFDPELKINNVFEINTKPNYLHYFLADMIKKGQNVMTTNFDSLIEDALVHSNISKRKIIPIITEKDYKQNENFDKGLKKGKLFLYKLHGSIKNIITGEDTIIPLINTIQKIGKNKKGNSLFQLEPYKQPLLNKILSGGSLVVMGYSGKNDLDILPMLRDVDSLDKPYFR
ncbi:MAG: SIR2 family protein [Candidatus Odinarchaeota archaeon]